MSGKKALDGALSEFIEEGQEIIHRVSENLEALQGEAGNTEVINSLYRDMHTMKGSAMLFGYGVIGRIAHGMEACLDPLRRFGIIPSPQVMTSALSCLELLDRIFRVLHNSTSDSEYSEQAVVCVSSLLQATSAQFSCEFLEIKDTLMPCEALERPNGNESPMVNPISSPSPTEDLTPKLSAEVKVETDSKQEGSESVLDSSIRVQVSLLDRLMTLVGELVLIRNQFIQYREKNDELELLNLSKSLDMVTSDLQGEVMKTRMQPIGKVTTKFQGLVKEIAKNLKKKVDLTLQGSETELDKSLLEAIKDPLTHIVRNSCDHGIESPEERKKASKPETGHLLIRSLHEGGQVVIEISDDGKGLSRQKITEKALKASLFSQEQLARMTDREVYNIIFLPGFSTAEQVTSVSGRGFGMNVVKNNVERIGGNVEIQSTLGKGTTIRLKIPLTLAIVPCLLIRTAGQRFAIPQVKLVELVRVDCTSNENQIEYLEGKPMYRLRGALLPLIDLREVIKVEPPAAKGDRNIVVLNAEGEYFGLMVDEILDTADIVVKPLNALLKSISTFSGATIMGDGSVALILDIMGVAPGAKRTSTMRTDDAHQFSIDVKKLKADALEFLVIKVCTKEDRTSHAVPLCLVHRLEEFTPKQIEYSGRQRVIRYRGALLPIISLAQSMGYQDPTPLLEGKAPAQALADDDSIFVIVVEQSGRFYGIEVADIVDIVTVEEQIDDSIRDRPGTLGNLIFQQQVIVVVDVWGVVEQSRIKLSPHGKAPAKEVQGESASPRITMDQLRTKNLEANGNRVRILYVEDVAFFRKQVSGILNQAGYEVTTVEDGQKALEVLEAAPEGRFNLILSDIEMPNMTGHELARALKKKERFKSLPMIALTTRFRDKDIQEGKEAGFALYLEKLNSTRLLEAVSSLMGGVQ